MRNEIHLCHLTLRVEFYIRKRKSTLSENDVTGIFISECNFQLSNYFHTILVILPRLIRVICMSTDQYGNFQSFFFTECDALLPPALLVTARFDSRDAVSAC